ncbi:MAG: homoserine dehydrogenase [Desulfobulbaceae bacterium]|nr:MAG: homoserine dehydrogenase [Desulfobulbaceae bacterium]
MREIRVGLIGFGTVGSGTAEVLRMQATRLRRKTGADIRLVRVADLNLTKLPREHAGVELTRDAEQVLTAPDLDIVVELIGGIEPAKTFILQAIAQGKHVVTANKALISQHGREIFTAAATKNVEVGFEASVGGGIPVIKALKEGLVANRIESIVGIMNGTSNYILNRMTDEGLDFATVLKDAQAHGYAEADPRYDIEGIDAAHKLVILMSIAYGAHVRLDQVSTEGISQIEPIDIEFAREFGYRIKLLAISRNHGDSYEARVHPTMISNQELLANIGGAFNAIRFTGDTVGDVLLYGQGAGKMPTGSAVVSDIVDIARNIINGAVNRVPSLGYRSENLREVEITPLDRLRCPYYFRVTVQNKPGVLAVITGILGKHGISIQSVLQQGRDKQGVVPVMMRVYEAREDAVRAALAKIDALDVCAAPTVKIRMITS